MKFKAVFYFCFSFFLTLLFLECFMNYSKIFPKSIHNYSEKYGKRRITDENFVFLNEGFGIRKFNEFGFSGDENISIFKTKKTFRIGLIGDSFIESLQVFERQYFGNILK